MNTPVQRSGPSIALRLIFVVLLAIIIPIAIVFFLIELEIRSIDEENLSLYLEDRGEDRLNFLNDSLATVVNDVESFVEIARLRSRLRLDLSQTFTDPAVELITNQGRVSLIDSGLFDRVDILTSGGSVLAHLERDPLAETSIETFVGTEDFDQLTRMSQLYAVERFTLSGEGADTNLVLRYVVYQGIEAARGGNPEEPVGFILATVNRDFIVESLRDQSGYVEINHYLMTSNGTSVLSDPDYEASALNSAEVIAPLLEDNNGFLDVETLAGNSLVHFGRIRNLPAFVVSEIPKSTSLTLSLRDVYSSGVLIAIVLGAVGVIAAIFLSLTITRPLASLNQAMVALTSGDFEHPVPEIQRSDEIGDVAQHFVSMRSNIRASVDNLENQLARRARDIKLTQEISSFAATQRDLQVLMDRVVDLIVELFPNIYHAQIFLIDEEGRQAVLRSSTGEVGRDLLARGHRLEVGSVSVIGQATQDERVVIARDISESTIHRRNEFLPDTRAELAVPLRPGNQIIGALDLQSRQSDSFRPEEVEILQTLADQIAIAIENARLYQESVHRLIEVGEISRKSVETAWREYLNYRREPQLNHRAGIINQTDLSPLRQMALTSGQVAIGAVSENNTIPFAVPIQLRGQILGAVEWELPANEFNEAKVQLAQDLVSRLAVSLDNARLFQETQRAVQREQMVNRIAAQLTGQTDIDGILQTAVKEVGQALRVPQVDIHFNWTNGNGNNKSAKEQGE